MPDLLMPLGDDTLPGYLAVPDGIGPWPGVVVVHEAFGLTDDIRGIADRFAGQGYVAFAPDLLAGGNRVACLVRLARAVSSGQGPAVAQLDAVRAWLAARPDGTGAVGIAGFCLGGGFAIVMASRGFGASAVQYARLPKNLEAAVRGSCPMVASYGELDGSLKGAAPRLEAALQSAGVEHDVRLYADTGHSFMNHSSVPGWMAPLARSMHAGYVDTSAADAWERILAMFGTALHPAADADAT